MLIRVCTCAKMKIFTYKQVISTQDLARQYLKGNATVGAFVAKSQTGGYGKQGRSFYSPPNSGIYYSVAVPNFNFAKNKIGLLTPYLATKIVMVLEQYFAKKFTLKWVNDIYYQGKKVAGILTEKVDNNLIIGVGINVNTRVFPKEISQKVGSITENSFEMKKLVDQLINATYEASQNYVRADFLAKYRQLSNVINQQVKLRIGKKVIFVKVIDIDKTGKLVVEVDGQIRKFASGEITKVELN